MELEGYLNLKILLTGGGEALRQKINATSGLQCFCDRVEELPRANEHQKNGGLRAFNGANESV